MADSTPHQAPAGKFDAGWTMAVETGWVDHGLDPTTALADLQLEGLPEGSTWGPSVLFSAGPFATARRTIADVSSGTFNDHLVRLASSFRPPRGVAPIDTAPASPTGPKWASASGGTLMALIDDGCPFAAEAFRKDGGTRVVALWDQNEVLRTAGRVLYGRAWGQDDLNKLIRAAQGDEQQAHQAAGLHSLRRRHTHGSHALARMAGSRYWDGRGSQAVDDACARADIAFVQLPEPVLRVVCGPAMEFHAFNAICQLIQWASEGGYERLVIVFPYETWLGPHDGTSWFERAADACLALPSGSGTPKVQLVLPAGNAAGRQGHCVPTLSERDPAYEWHLALAPASELATWMEVWLPKHWSLDKLSLVVTPPGGAGPEVVGPLSQWSSAGNAPSGLHCVVERWKPVGYRRRLLLRLDPTATGGGGPIARHGLWHFRLQRSGGFRGTSQKDVLVYTARVDPGMGRTRFAHQSWFPTSAADARTRTLNGHAGGRSVLVAGAALSGTFPYHQDGWSQLGGIAAPYSGVPAPVGRGRLVDVKVATEDGVWLPGQLGAGSTSATTFRMSGTSVAAPTLARWLGNERLWPNRPGILRDKNLLIDQGWPFTTVAAAAP